MSISEENPDVTIKMENVGHLSEFDAINSIWPIYKRRMDNYFIANEITDNKRKRAILLNLLNEETYQLVFNLCLPIEPEKKSYSDLINLIDKHFKPTVSIFAARYKFYNAKKEESESSREWIARLRSLAAACDFEATFLQIVLRDVFIIGYNPGAVQDRLLEEGVETKLEKVVAVALAKSVTKPMELSLSMVKQEPPEVHYVGPGAAEERRRSRFRGASSPAFVAKSSCKVCGRQNHTTERCAFKDYACHACGKKGHLATVCMNKKVNFQNYLEPEDNNCLYHLNFKSNPILLDIEIENVMFTLSLDTGSTFVSYPGKFLFREFKK